MILLSFILPVFNVEKYIYRCLDSIYALPIDTSYFEVLCIDDCSTDKSTLFIETYQERYSNLRLIRHQQNARQGAARNTGIRHAKGTYCMFVDPDDSLPTLDILALLNHMQDNNIELLLGKANIIASNEKKTLWGNPPIHESIVMHGPEIFINEDVLKIAYGVVWLAIYKLDLVRRIPPFLENVQYEDTDWTLRCAYEASLLQYIPQVLYNYHVNPSTTTTTKSIRKLIDRTKQSLRIYKWAHHTTKLREEVIFVAKDYVVWNLKCLSSLINFTYKERKMFYQAFSSEEIQIISSWKLRSYARFIICYPFISNVLLILIRPCYKLFKFVKSTLLK